MNTITTMNICQQCEKPLTEKNNLCPHCQWIQDITLVSQKEEDWGNHLDVEEDSVSSADPSPLTYLPEYQRYQQSHRLQEQLSQYETLSIASPWKNPTLLEFSPLEAPKLHTLHLTQGLNKFQGRYFPHAPNLEQVEIPSTLSSFQLGSLRNTPWFEKHKSRSPLFLQGDGILLAYTGTESHVILPEGIKTIGDACFQCHPMERITLPNSLTHIASLGFSHCPNLRQIHLPKALTSIDSLAFSHCTNLEEVFFHGELEYLGEDVFYHTPFFQSHQKESPSLLQIGESLLWQGQGLHTLHLEKSKFQTLAPYCFALDPSLEEIYLPETGLSLGKGSFYHCTQVRELHLPKDIHRIPQNAFRDCQNLREIHIPPSVKQIQTAAFQGCIHISTLTIPEGVEEIQSYAFRDCIHLRDIHLPTSLRNLGQGVFEGCTALERVTFAQGEECDEHIPEPLDFSPFLFAQCPNLSQITLPDREIQLEVFSFDLETLLTLETDFFPQHHEVFLAYLTHYPHWEQWFYHWDDYPKSEKQWQGFFQGG